MAGGAGKRFGFHASNVSLAVALGTLLVGAGLLPADQAEAEQGRAATPGTLAEALAAANAQETALTWAAEIPIFDSAEKNG